MARHDREDSHSLEEQLAWLDAISKESPGAPGETPAATPSPYPKDPWLAVPKDRRPVPPPLFRAVVDSVYGPRATPAPVHDTDPPAAAPKAEPEAPVAPSAARPAPPPEPSPIAVPEVAEPVAVEPPPASPSLGTVRPEEPHPSAALHKEPAPVAEAPGTSAEAPSSPPAADPPDDPPQAAEPPRRTVASPRFEAIGNEWTQAFGSLRAQPQPHPLPVRPAPEQPVAASAGPVEAPAAPPRPEPVPRPVADVAPQGAAGEAARFERAADHPRGSAPEPIPPAEAVRPAAEPRDPVVEAPRYAYNPLPAPPAESPVRPVAAEPPVRPVTPAAEPAVESEPRRPVSRKPMAPTPELDDPFLPRRDRREGPSSGWRRLIYRASVGLIRPGESPEELRRRDLMARARTPVTRGHHRVAVLSLKGGVGKTTTTVGLGAMLAQVRGDRVIAVDANPDRGTLSDKLELETAATVRDLLNEQGQIQRYADVRAFTSQAPSRLEVLASDRDPAVSEAFSAADYRSVARLLENFYSICITDCGTGLLHSAMTGVLGLADQIVLVSSPSVDGARAASATLDWLEAHHHANLVRSATVVLSMVRPRSKSSVDLDRLESHFAARCRAVVRVPYDPHLEEGAEIDLERLQQATRTAYLRLSAAVGDGFSEV
ncbi:MinD/ParA family ATP-binding protein [Rhizohabitans arisaemae]|uniref:MinD/ParA family ATP-binding protein n=1 Tax=Rhizohabitans arisaemae TaxID=2720610 RepID=UPI0024B1D054|nr:AAA family ATPase [Rhizohabitans arisaemae]